MRTCLIITCYNRPAYLAQTLDSLKKLTTLPNAIVIIDDCSTDEETLQIIDDFWHYCQVEKVYLEANLGIKNALKEACFVAFNILSADLVINLDSDAIVRPHFIPTILNLKLRFPHSIVSGFNCNNLDNPVIGTGDGYVIRKKCNGINMCFDKGQFNHYIKPALLKEGDWDNQVEAPFIISSPSVVQHIGEESAMGHPRFDQAEDYKILPKMKISIIHPSRGRAEQAYLTAEKWLSRAKNRDNLQYWLSLDSDDTSHEGYMHEFMNKLGGIMCCTYPNNSAIEAINYAATKCDGDLIVVVSDDFDCPHHWDELLIQSLRGKEDFVVKTDDGVQPWIITLPIMDRKYYERFGYIYNPLYRHMFADTEMTHVADLLDKKITLPITFTHLHYSTGASAKDSINEKNDSTWDQGKAVYLEGMKNDFGLGDQIRGRLSCNQEHYDWLVNEGINPKIRPILSILIPTINGREEKFERLVKSLLPQVNHNPDIEILFAKDDKTVSIGAKRQQLLHTANGEYIVMLDDDDSVAEDYVSRVMKALEEKPDCVGYPVSVNFNGELKKAIHSNMFSAWAEDVGGYDYVRTPFCKNPIKTEIARKVGYADLRYGEDVDYANRLQKSGLLKKEVFIEETMYFYTANSMSDEDFKERYGLGNTAEQDYLDQNAKGFEGDSFLQKHIEKLVLKHEINVIIELGTFLGSTTLRFREMVPQVATVEIDHDYYLKAWEKFKGTDINSIHSSSVDALPQLLKIYRGNFLIYIDSHWGNNNPLLRELEIIKESGVKPVIAIHDFKVPGKPELQYDSYNGQDYDWPWIKRHVDAIYGINGYDHSYNSEAEGAKRGVVFIEPCTQR